MQVQPAGAYADTRWRSLICICCRYGGLATWQANSLISWQVTIVPLAGDASCQS